MILKMRTTLILNSQMATQVCSIGNFLLATMPTPPKKQVKCVLRTTGLQVYEEYFSLIKFCSGCLLTKASFWSSKSILSKCNERGHINWGHTLFSKISIIFIVVKPSHSLYNYSNIEILYKKVRDGVGEGGGRVGVDGRVGHGGLDVFMCFLS